MLAPGIMISACGLLLLGMNNKYSLVVNRIRTLDGEFRELEKDHNERRKSILIQLPLLIKRMRLIRNAVWFYTIAIAMFIFSIITIGIYFFTGKTLVASIVAFAIFIIALLAVFAGIIHAAKEVRLGYSIIKIEAKTII
ncbi:MAG: DUF2721 domain-containing protein [Bacteroidetes bacterium]|nr:DUF2721 domain-containing protein [Bacteroidota bacterium]MBL6942750.1 DUF2721 domain-containing protein [Bacteroidales bacterium]